MSETLLVTGASGQMGRRVLELLLEAGVAPASIIATTRTPDKLADFANRGITVRAADFDDPASLAAAFAGANRLLLISTDILDPSGRRLQQHRNAVSAAEAAGVSHVLYTSIVNANDTPDWVAHDHYGTEQALTASKMGFTSLRNNIYTEMLIGSAQRAASLGQWFSAGASGRVAYVTREDCSRAAAAALADSFTGRRILEITGPIAYSGDDLAALTTTITGQPVTYVPIPLESLIQGMEGAGIPRPIAEIYASFDDGTAQGKHALVSNAFEELTGRKPTSAAEYLIAHKSEIAQPASQA